MIFFILTSDNKLLLISPFFSSSFAIAKLLSMKREIYPTKITQLVNGDREEASFLQETFLKFDEGIFRFGGRIAPREKLYALADCRATACVNAGNLRKSITHEGVQAINVAVRDLSRPFL